MNDFYRSFVDVAKCLAVANGLPWDLPYDSAGSIAKGQGWNLTKLAGMVPPPAFWLSDLGLYEPGLAGLNLVRAQKNLSPMANVAMPSTWQDIYKAVILHEIIVRKNKPGYGVNCVGRSIRLLAACADGVAPWDIHAEHVQLAYNVALSIGESGKIAANLAMAVRTVIDGLHLADRSPLARFCLPFPTDEAKAAQSNVEQLRKHDNNYWHTGRARAELHERKTAGKLPEEKAFWELVRIVFTEAPKTFTDAIRFAQVKIAIVTGFRIGENVMIPLDWERRREYVDAKGHPAGERGGVSRSLMIRHFAEKQAADEGPEGVVLYEAAQHVPPMFEDVVLETLNGVAAITQPLREKLRRQTETGRLLPEFAPDDLVPVIDLYTRISGSLWFLNESPPEKLFARYREHYDPSVIEEIRAFQNAMIHNGRVDAISKYWHPFLKGKLVTPRDSAGATVTDRCNWKELYLRVSDVEEMIRQRMPSKLPHTDPFTFADGAKLYPHDLLFLMPVRALVENRNDGIVDIERYFAVGRCNTVDLHMQLGGQDENLFSRYGETKEDRQRTIRPHSLRHLQNTELFRLGVADTIITKRFNRRSVAQSYEYDHRSLAEDLASINLPSEATARVGPRAQEALKLIQTGKVRGPIVEEFYRIQRELGDNAAFDYLDAEADGLHVTPYGFCLNSFTVDPCPKHLECFNGCRHLARSEVPEEQRNLERLRDRMTRAIAKIESMPVTARNIGWQNQLTHATVRLANIGKALAAKSGVQPFPDGPDLFQPLEAKLGGTILDHPKTRRNNNG
jgi:hypothetical protein